MAEMTIAKAMKTERQSRLLVTSASYDSFAYSNRFAGSVTTDRTVLIAVIATLNAKSALNSELHLKKYLRRIRWQQQSRFIGWGRRIFVCAIEMDIHDCKCRRSTHQLLNEPPGLLVSTSSVIPRLASRLKMFTAAKPKNGNKTNWQKIPSRIAVLFCICFFMQFMSTVADIPNTKANRSRLPITSRIDIIVEMFPE